LKIEEKAVQSKKFRTNWKFNDDAYKKTFKPQRHPCNSTDPDLLCGVIFVDKGFTAKIIFYLLNVCVYIYAYILLYIYIKVCYIYIYIYIYIYNTS